MKSTIQNTVRSTNRLFATLGLCAVLMLATEARAESFLYEIHVDTSALSGSGYLDFQFDPGNTLYDPASARLSGFSTNGTLTTPASPFGDVTGALPGTVTIRNTDLPNEYTPGIVFGSFFDFVLTLDIPIVSGSATGGNSFTLDVEDTGFNSLLGSFPTVEIDLNATTGAPTIINNSGGAATITGAPEPGTLLLAASVGGWLVWRRRPVKSGPETSSAP